VRSDNIDDSKVVEDVNILLEITSIVEDPLVNSGTPIIDEVHASSNSTSDDVDEIVESNISALTNFSCCFYRTSILYHQTIAH